MPNKSSNSLSTLATRLPVSPDHPLDPSLFLNPSPIRSAGQLKTAADPLQDQRKRELLKSLFGLGIAGVGLGAGARAGIGLHQLLTQSQPPVARTSSIPETINIPSLQPDPTADDAINDDDLEASPLTKLAAALVKQADLMDNAANMVPQPVVDAIPNISNSGHPLASWQGMPAALAVGGGGIAGGWSLMDWLAKHRRKRQQEQEVGDARDEFRQSLANEYRTAMMAKNADEHDSLDQAFEQWQQKAASAIQQGTNALNMIGGLYGATALGLGGASAYATYKATKARSARRMLQKAIEARARQRAAPQPIYAVPTGDLATV